MEQNDNQIARISGALRRRWRLAVATLVIGTVAATLLAVLLPPTYQSVATVYVEPPDVKANGMDEEELPEQQIARVSQRVLTTTNLAEVVRRTNLYAESNLPVTERVQRLEDNFRLETVTASGVDSRGRPTQTVVTFELSFDHPQAVIAQRVLNQLVTLYRSENAEIRSTRVRQRLDFLESESSAVARSIQQREREVAAFLAENAGVTPGAQQSTIQLLQRAESERLETDRRLRAVEDRLIYLRAELAQLESQPAGSGRRDAPLLPQDQLLAARANLRSLTARYGDDHPDVVAARRAVAALEAEVADGAGNRAGEADARLAALQAELATARQRYTDNHPEVMRLQREIESARAEAAEAGAELAVSDPATARLRADLASALAESRSLLALREQQSARISALEEALAKLPEVEVRYRDMARDLDYLRAQYQALKEQELNAGVALAVEQQRRGQKFVVIEQPSLPQEPYKPNRLAILFVGLVLAMGLAALIVAIAEALDLRIHGRDGITRVLGSPPLASIPVIPAYGEAAAGGAGVAPAPAGVSTRRLVMAGALGLVLLAVGLVVVHTQVEELPILWFRLLRSAGL